MGAIVSCASSCVGTLCGGCINQLCSQSANQKTRGPYMFLVFIGVVISLLLRYYGNDLSLHFFYFSMDLCSSSRCLGNQGIYRISMALAIFFLLMMILVAINNRWHATLWLPKIFAIVALCIGFFFVSNNKVFTVWAEISRFVSILFLILQIIVLIDFTYTWNAKWVAKEWYKPILFVCAALYITSIVFWGFFFKWFADSPMSDQPCHVPKFFISFTIILCIAITILSISGLNEHSALLPSACTTAYATFLLYSSLTSDPSTCNSTRSQSSSTGVQIAQLIIGILIAGFSVVKSAWDLSNANLFGQKPIPISVEDEERQIEQGSPLNRDHVVNVADVKLDQQKSSSSTSSSSSSPTHSSKAVEDVAEEDAEDPQARRSNLFFHGSMFLACCYFCMLLSNWGNANASDSSSYDLGEDSMWVKIASQWVTLLLYGWTVVAPILFPDRDFS